MGFDRHSWAIETAARVHRGQTDKGGVLYMDHVLAVREAVRGHGEDAMIVAVLHDAIEDFEGSPIDRLKLLHDIGIACGEHVKDALYALTKGPNEAYENYIERVAENWLARVVKIADLTHNMDPRRIPAGQIVDKDFARWDKYRRALIRLERA